VQWLTAFPKICNFGPQGLNNRLIQILIRKAAQTRYVVKSPSWLNTVSQKQNLIQQAHGFVTRWMNSHGSLNCRVRYPKHCPYHFPCENRMPELGKLSVLPL